ncbi:hypothetical protein [Actinoplanes lutulentus]|nr:hypothetical protein [Actinoplanes lutulentus]
MTTFVAAALAACDSSALSSSDLSSSDQDFSLGPRLTVTLKLDGAITVTGEQTALAPSGGANFLKSCSEYAQGNTEQALFMSPGLLDGDVDGKKVTIEMWIDDYTGPGSFPKDRLAAPGSSPSIAVDNVIYATWPDSTGSKAVINDDGSGEWTFTKLATTGPGGLPGDAVDGSVSWTCRDK